jgi:opacity protein-like surface antigen
MKRVVTIAMSAVLMLGIAQVPAQAAHHYSNCTALHRDYSHGVAKSKRAARREVNDGYGYPHVSRRLYRANNTLDANKDGVACES